MGRKPPAVRSGILLKALLVVMLLVLLGAIQSVRILSHYDKTVREQGESTTKKSLGGLDYCQALRATVGSRWTILTR